MSLWVERSYRQVVFVLGSNAFFYGVLVLAVLQALWYTLGFHPWINDEARHLGIIGIYSHHVSPFLGSQNLDWDRYGQIARDGSYMFYWLMSWPLRALQLLTDSSTTQIIGLRIVSMSFFAVGLAVYRKALLEITGLPKSVVQLALLLFVTTPAAALLAGTVNYDNAVFVLFAIILLLAVRVIKSRTVLPKPLSGILALGLFIPLVKWTAFALVLPVIVFVVYDLLRKHGLRLPSIIIKQASQLSRPALALIILALTVGGFLFIERPVMNTIRYGNPEASCQAVIGVVRCQQSPDFVSYQLLDSQKTNDFKAYDPARYLFVYWVPTVTDKASNLIERGRDSELPIIKAFDYGIAYIWILVVLLAWRQISRNRYNQLLLTVLVVYVGLLIVKEYAGYLRYEAPVAIRARYLVPVLPIALYIGGAAIIELYGKYKKSLLFLSIAVLLITTQGGSIVTHLFTAPQSAYWPNSQASAFNDTLKQILSPFVKR
ncbi:hypothetical protein BH09PAT4_BH09PAT4_02020 [soil metagenome]